jgi:glycosyltransferase XagB
VDRGSRLAAADGCVRAGTLPDVPPREGRTAFSATDIAVADLLVERRILTLDQLDLATERASTWGVGLADILMANSWMRPREFYRTVTQYFDLVFVDLMGNPPEPELLDQAMAGEYARQLLLPWRRNGESW